MNQKKSDWKTIIKIQVAVNGSKFGFESIWPEKETIDTLRVIINEYDKENGSICIGKLKK